MAAAPPSDASQSETPNKDTAAYGYLCRLEEAKKWLEYMLKEPVPMATELETALQSGVLLCRLSMVLLPDEPMWKKVYDLDLAKFKSKGLDYRYTDNINFWLKSLQLIGLPKVFYPVMTDVYHKKNMPKVIYCIHALSHLLKRQHKVPQAVDDLTGTASFTPDALAETSKALLLRQRTMPAFGLVENLVEEELQYQAIGITGCFEEDNAHPSTPLDVTPSDLPTPIFDDPKYISTKTIATLAAHSEVTQLHVWGDFPHSQTMPRERTGAIPVPSPRQVRTSSSSTLPRGITPRATEPGEGGEGVWSKAEDARMREEKAVYNVSFLTVPCALMGVQISLYHKHTAKRDAAKSAVDTALDAINHALESGNADETLHTLQCPDAKLPFPGYVEAERYYDALMAEKENGLPNSVIPVFCGMDREMSEDLLKKMDAGAYVIRDSRTLDGAFAFSFRNNSGIKHWKLNTKNGQFFWGNVPSHDTLDAFVEHFIGALAQITNLHIFPGMTASLQPNIRSPDQQTIIDTLRDQDKRLSQGQICRVIKAVNAEMRESRRASISGHWVKQDGQLWNPSMVLCVNRTEAEAILTENGVPGSFVVRPSERTPGDYAMAFRTTDDIRHWRIVQNKDKYYVHPRPHPYETLEEIVLHFQDAVGEETGLDMVPLIHKVTSSTTTTSPPTHPPPTHPPPAPSTPSTPSTPAPPHKEGSDSGQLLIPTGEQVMNGTLLDSSTLGRHAEPSGSLSKLNPANLTSWTPDDVCQWLAEQGLGPFVPVFRENAVDGECLFTLDHNLLKTEMGILPLGHRSRILKRVQALKDSIHPGLT